MFFTRRRRSIRKFDLSPDEIFVDASNLPGHDEQQFEGHLEQAISRSAFWGLAIFCVGIFLIFVGRTFWLAVVEGEYYADRSKNNSLNFTTIFAERGNIYDRTGQELAWTDNGTSTEDVAGFKRVYLDTPGLGHIVGYVSFPNAKEFETGLYHPEEFLGRDGVERSFNEELLGERGKQVIEVNVRGEQVSDHVIERAIPGQEIHLSIDYRIQTKLYEFMDQIATERGFAGGAAAIMDIETGELLALVSYPDYNSNTLAKGHDTETIKKYFTDDHNYMLNRSISGLYTPGSTFKPFVAIGALAEKIIDPRKEFVTDGELVVPNPYDKTQKTVFKDWKNNGVVDMRRAIAVSCNVYFYIIGGGFGSQSGLGIEKIGEYAKIFGLDSKTDIDLFGEAEGSIPSPEWKAENFDGEPWRLGDTYHTSIGQYGVQITPLELVRAYTAIANSGKMIKPTILKITPEQVIVQKNISLDSSIWKVIHEGMRQTVTDGSTQSLNTPGVEVAAKSGSAELGISKANVNSWIAGYWPYGNPRYSFVVVMERGPRDNIIGGAAVMRQLLDWMTENTPEYLK
ncbi:MAG TPA: penicillin-binding transpeptidase domain-containing protein [Candidatus Paceibacterota bacterium]|nr:penicillin-binding transpeptidase domain-containing protein [Candidatus Paceibacterota bacterium]